MGTVDFLTLLNDKLGVRVTEDQLRTALTHNPALKAYKVRGAYVWEGPHAMKVAKHFGIDLSLEMSDVIGGVRISTIDLKCTEHPGGMFYESMIFGTSGEELRQLFKTKQEAIAVHLNTVAIATARRKKR